MGHTLSRRIQPAPSTPVVLTTTPICCPPGSPPSALSSFSSCLFLVPSQSRGLTHAKQYSDGWHIRITWGTLNTAPPPQVSVYTPDLLSQIPWKLNLGIRIFKCCPYDFHWGAPDENHYPRASARRVLISSDRPLTGQDTSLMIFGIFLFDLVAWSLSYSA